MALNGQSVTARAIPVRVGFVAVCIIASLVAGARHTAASEPPAPLHPLLNNSLARPHLEAPQPPVPAGIHLPNTTAPHLLLASQGLEVPAQLRVLIFAPHPDDETIAAGGLIQRVLAKHGQVRIIFVTNGDGYVDGVRREVKGSRVSTTDFIEYGRRRHDEALRALHGLGLGASDAVFLGFPDDGIDDLWAGHWSPQKPYISPYTRFAHPPYKESLSQRVEYAGADLEEQITRTLRDFSPDWVLMPDPRDRHPDHCTTGVFVLDALRKLRHAGDARFRRTQVLAYLVHSPDYPASPAWVREIAGAGVGGSATAGRALSTAQWFSLPLTDAELAGKRAAMTEYQSQVLVMNPFLKQFLRSIELFARLEPAQVMTVPNEYAARFGRSH